ncbi:MAG TPA: hypothetical protein VGM04_06435 [Sphingomicrobium sp.]|jgi:hypothetical protein
MLRSWKRIARAAMTFAAVIVLAMPLSAQDAISNGSSAYDLEPPTRIDEALIFSGTPVILTNDSRRPDNRGWMELETDSCGILRSGEDSRSVISRAAFADDIDDLDDFDDEDPADLGREMIGRWLSEHPEIAIVNDGVDKECDDGGWYDEEELPGDFEASLPNRAPRNDRLEIA